jgi:hypothetical protein
MKHSPCIYAIGGLGADARVFEHLTTQSKIKPLAWIRPKNLEPLRDYAIRLKGQIDQRDVFGIMGVSFGGLVAIELSKVLNPTVTILISSASNKAELKSPWLPLGKLGILKLLPSKFQKTPNWLANWLFSAQNTKLLNDIIHETDPMFIKWALQQMRCWDNGEAIKNMVQIHGTADRLIPMNNRKCISIKNGGHFMIVDRADEVSKVIDEQITYNI